jgi:hypothetical protein
MKLMAKLLRQKNISYLIAALKERHFKEHPLNAPASTKAKDSRCNHDSRFINEDVKMGADLSGIFVDESKRKGSMPIAVVVGDPLVDLKNYIEEQLPNLGKTTTKEERKKIVTSIYNKLKGVNDEGTRIILNTLDPEEVRKIYRNVLPLSGKEPGKSSTKKEDRINDLVRATST